VHHVIEHRVSLKKPADKGATVFYLFADFSIYLANFSAWKGGDEPEKC
jgi:hypothetical protein